MLDIQVIDDPAAATVALEPMRSRLLSELVEPASAATLATRVGLARQKVNYHLHALEAHGLVRLAEERKWGGLTERLLVATAASYVVSPSALGPVAVDPNREVDRLSASYLIALGARVVREVGDLVRRAEEAGQRLNGAEPGCLGLVVAIAVLDVPHGRGFEYPLRPDHQVSQFRPIQVGNIVG